MREILFRGKRVDNGEWVYGNLAVYDRGEVVEIDNGHEHTCLYDVIPETVGQYTGLTDNNGKRIFEGDVVKIFLKDGCEIGPIMWSNIGARYKFASPDGTAYSIDATDVCEVIGNIHDNPELVGGDT